MHSNEDVEEAVNGTIDNLPLPFMIFGKKKEHNPLEDFWMSKLEAIESQYNEHIVKLERSLLDNRANQRKLIQKEERISRIKGDLKEKTEKLQSITKQTNQLQSKLTLQSYKNTRLNDKLTKSEEIKSKVLKTLESERFERIKSEKEITGLKQRLENLERDKKFLVHEVSIKDSERKRVEEREAHLASNKFNLIKNLTDIDQERRIQAEVNYKLVEDIARLLDGTQSQDYRLVKQRKEIDLMLESMKLQQQEQEETLRKLKITENSMRNVGEENKFSKEKLEHLERQVRHWKEEFLYKENDKNSSELELKDLHRENSHLRCQLAELREKLNRNESRLKSLEIEKQRTDVELQKAKGQAKSVQMVMCRNELVKQKLAKKILKDHPSIQMTLEERYRDKGPKTGQGKKRSATDNEIESYKKKIWQLERQKEDLERNINESRAKRSRMQLKMKRYDGMERQILWTEKAMVKIDGDRNRLEDLLKMMSLNVPNKMPFEKLVTDPSILDRISKYQVLQKRLSKQTDMVQNLKRNAIKIFEYRKLQMEDQQTDKRRETPPWKLSHWKYSSEDTLADVNDMFDPEGQPLSERKYYKDYVAYLDSEIPQIKKKIAFLERRQQYNLQQRQDAETKTKKTEEIARLRQESMDEQIPIGDGMSTPPLRDPLEIVLEDGEEEEEDQSYNGTKVSIDEAEDYVFNNNVPEEMKGAETEMSQNVLDDNHQLDGASNNDGASDDDVEELENDIKSADD